MSISCNFCNQVADEHDFVLIAGAGGKPLICEDCIRLAVATISRMKREENESSKNRK